MKSWYIASGKGVDVVVNNVGGSVFAEGVRGFERDVLPAIASGHVRPVIDKVFPFAELPQAKAHMESNAHLGKIILRS